MPGAKYAKVVVGLPVEGPFDYMIPDRFLKAGLKKGSRVKVPFRNLRLTGYVVGLSPVSKIANPRSLLEILDDEPILDESLSRLSREVADYYCCSWGEAVEAALPKSLRQGVKIQSTSGVKDLNKKEGSYETSEDPRLQTINEALVSNKFKLFLIHDNCGLGRWQPFIEIIKSNFSQGRRAILLVPDLNAAHEAIQAIKAKISLSVGLVHSSLTARQDLDIWQRAKLNEFDLIVGTRKAVFSPLKKLGLIIVDDEESSVYKQENVPHYNARDVAIMRGRLEHTTVVLRSPTPSLESYYLVKKGLAQLLKIKDSNRKLPQIQLVDMRRHYQTAKKQKILFSRALLEETKKTLDAGKKAAFFINRGGFASISRCRNCGLLLRCPRCNIGLTYYYAKKQLSCHHCNFKMPLPEICPACNSSYIVFKGLGTEKIESEIARIFPNFKITLLDKDKTLKGPFDILVSSQIILKQLKHPIDLMGVLAIDSLLNRVDFRSAERTYALLARLSLLVDSKMIIQTFHPENYCFKALKSSDYQNFINEELKNRRQLNFPPVGHLVCVYLKSKDEARARDASQDLFNAFTKTKSTVNISSPHESSLFKLRENFRMQILLKSKNHTAIRKLLDKNIKSFRKGSVTVIIDVDPYF